MDAGLAVPAFFTERSGGASLGDYASLNVADHVGDTPVHVAANRATVEFQAGVPVSFLKAEHGIRVATVTAAGEEPPPADVLVTHTPGVAIATIAADCVPVLLHDEASGAVAAVHAGREGVYSGVVDAAVAAILDYRGGWKVPGRLHASIGPAICGRCYEVPAQMRARVTQRHPSALSTTSQGTPALDLPRAVEVRLGELGFTHIVRSPVCTFEDARWFSHRRDGTTGRFAGVIRCA